jgi:hypothetical protein
MTSVDAANAWRAVYAPPRRRRQSVQQVFNSKLVMPPDAVDFVFPAEWYEPPALDFTREELAGMAFDDSPTE